jgi:hypothetical protein
MSGVTAPDADMATNTDTKQTANYTWGEVEQQAVAAAEAELRRTLESLPPAPLAPPAPAILLSAADVDDLNDVASDLATLKEIAKPRGGGRGAGGRFASGNDIGLSTQFGTDNEAALKHGLYARRAALLPEQAARSEEMERLSATIVNELGGPEKVGTLRIQAVDDYLRFRTLSERAWQAIDRGGLFTPKGRTRACVSLLMALYTLMERAAQQIIGDRRVRRRLGAQRHASLSKTIDALLANR